MEQQQSLFEAYQRWWDSTSSVRRRRADGLYTTTPKATPERYALMAKMAEWCRCRGLDPHLWLFILFRGRRWMYAPKLRAGDLLSEKFLASGRYEAAVERGALDGYVAERKGPQRAADPNVDLIPRAERMKAVLTQQGDLERCIRELWITTYGWHPGSRWCQSCSVATVCRTRLAAAVNFDIVALREGRITVEEAKKQAGGKHA